MTRLSPCAWIVPFAASVALASPAHAGSDGRNAGEARPGNFHTAASARFATPAAARVAAAYGVITSTYRSVAHNRAVGGVSNSYHLTGQAFDVARRPGVTHRQIAAALRSAGYALIESLDEGDHSHFALGSSTAASANVPVSSPAPERSPLPSVKRLAADRHGTLYLDLQSSSGRRQAR